MKENRRAGGFLQSIATFSAGAAVVGLVALLCAPASGRVTRRRLEMRVRTTQRRIGRRIEQTQRELVHKADDLREAATDWITEHVPYGNGRSAARRVIHHA